jgi:hypothetical protein
VLVASGVFALYLASTSILLPHDVAFLGFGVDHLCNHFECRVVHFMAHDRVAFGGSIIAIGLLFQWLANVPLRRSEPWAWWALALSGLLGFASFLAYLGYGYLDTWHGWATLALFPFFAAGIYLTRNCAAHLRNLRYEHVLTGSRRLRVGRGPLALTAAGMVLGGLIILVVGMTAVFVPQDLEFMGARPTDLHAISNRLIPLIAHDRSGFGGGLVSTGIAILFIALFGFGERDRGCWATIAASGIIGFACAIGVHFVVGYTSLTHLLPAYVGALMFLGAVVALRPADRSGVSR